LTLQKEGRALKFDVFLPISGRAASAVLTDAARRAEALGYDSVWAADRIVTPWEINTLYPYSADQRFIVPPDIPSSSSLSRASPSSPAAPKRSRSG
jgi:alkanesulfonate monooxygenase SsuD/methylene tetrahydromethanopterin reductase-like flavin-dependent oxidoreductase (luciferase family)